MIADDTEVKVEGCCYHCYQTIKEVQIPQDENDNSILLRID